MEALAVSDIRKNWARPEHVEFANTMIKHYQELDSKKMERIRLDKNYKLKKKKYYHKKMMCRNVVIVSIKKGSLKQCDKGMLKSRNWARCDEFGNKLHDEKDIVIKVERYDILAFVRLLFAAKTLGSDTFEDFLSIYDVRKIMDNIKEDYFGDLKLFLDRESI